MHVQLLKKITRTLVEDVDSLKRRPDTFHPHEGFGTRSSSSGSSAGLAWILSRALLIVSETPRLRQGGVRVVLTHSALEETASETGALPPDTLDFLLPLWRKVRPPMKIHIISIEREASENPCG